MIPKIVPIHSVYIYIYTYVNSLLNHVQNHGSWVCTCMNSSPVISTHLPAPGGYEFLAVVHRIQPGAASTGVNHVKNPLPQRIL